MADASYGGRFGRFGRFAAVQEVKGLEDGKFEVEIEGEIKSLGLRVRAAALRTRTRSNGGRSRYFKPKYVIPCDFQPGPGVRSPKSLETEMGGMFCYWMKSDDDVPRDHLGGMFSHSFVAPKVTFIQA